MKMQLALAALAAAVATAYAGPFDAFKGKMKEGMYEYKMDMDMGQMPGMPPGMGKQSRTFQHCVTKKDIDEGGFGKSPRDKQQQERCQIKNMNVSGNTATYTMECTDPPMKADNKIDFTDSGFNMDMKMQMTRQGQTMNMSQHMEGRYIGACK
jgi:hypothetical protein